MRNKFPTLLRVSFLITVLFSATFVLDDVVTRGNSHRSTAAAADAPKSAFGKHPHGYDDPLSSATCHSKIGAIPGPLHARGQRWCVADLKWEVSAGNSLETLVNHRAKFMPEFMNPVYVVENLAKVVVILGLLVFATVAITVGVWCSCNSMISHFCIQYPVYRGCKLQATTDTDAGKYLVLDDYI